MLCWICHIPPACCLKSTCSRIFRTLTRLEFPMHGSGQKEVGRCSPCPTHRVIHHILEAINVHSKGIVREAWWRSRDLAILTRTPCSTTRMLRGALPAYQNGVSRRMSRPDRLAEALDLISLADVTHSSQNRLGTPSANYTWTVANSMDQVGWIKWLGFWA